MNYFERRKKIKRIPPLKLNKEEALRLADYILCSQNLSGAIQEAEDFEQLLMRFGLTCKECQINPARIREEEKGVWDADH